MTRFLLGPGGAERDQYECLLLLGHGRAEMND